MECLVHKCENQDYQGNGFFLNVTEPNFGKVGHEWICAPCWGALRGYQGVQYSQVFRNMKEKMFAPSHDVEEYYKED